jgi:Flp pilus assembly pilin Flp
MDAITTRMTSARLAVTAYVAGAVERSKDDRGQGSIEYAGIIFVVAALMIALVALAKTDTAFKTAIMSKIGDAVNSLTP